MIRPRTALVALALAAIGVAGCGGGKDASQSDVQGDVEDRLLEDGYVSGVEGEEPIDVSAEDAAAIGNCVARTMFESTDEFTREERNAATRSSDGDAPDPDLVLKVEALVNDCYDEVVDGGGGSGDDEDGGEDQTADEETTTTEG
jgi:hypothetical protein